MGKRKRPRALVDRLPIRPPFTKEEWGNTRLSQVLYDPKCLDYFERCRKEIGRSGRAEVYTSRLAGIAHIGRLIEFSPRSYDKFQEEADAQPISLPKLEMALDIILEGVAKKRIALNPVEQFEFLSFTGEFLNCLADQYGGTDSLRALTKQALGAALLSFIVAVNEELGCGP